MEGGRVLLPHTDRPTDLEEPIGLGELGGLRDVGDVRLGQRVAEGGHAIDGRACLRRKGRKWRSHQPRYNHRPPARPHARTDEEEPRVLGEGGDNLPGPQAYVGHCHKRLATEAVRERARSVDEQEGDGLVLRVY